MDILAMQSEVYGWAVSKGWEPDLARQFGDECSLLHSEISEALEAYRGCGFSDATDPETGKPEGVGSELADILIRLLHYAEVRGFSLLNCSPAYAIGNWSFGVECARLHACVSRAFDSWEAGRPTTSEAHMRTLLRLLLSMSAAHGFDLAWEYRRKMDFNRTRAYRHGNKAM